MVLIRAKRTPYLSIDPETKRIYWTGRTFQGPVRFLADDTYVFAGRTYAKQELLITFFPDIAAQPLPSQVRAQGVSLRNRLVRK